jgi:imidazolonepropionase-like amidohydrolase
MRNFRSLGQRHGGAPGAHADLLVVDGDPLRDTSLLAADGKNLRMIVKGGEIVKDELR